MPEMMLVEVRNECVHGRSKKANHQGVFVWFRVLSKTRVYMNPAGSLIADIDVSRTQSR